MNTRETVEAFVRAINSGDADVISACMDKDHVFIDSLGNRVAGRSAMIAGWRAYLGMFPDYRIRVEGLMVDGGDALLWGWAEGTFHRDGGAAANDFWTAVAALSGSVGKVAKVFWFFFSKKNCFLP